MAKVKQRKDSKGRVLQTGETQRKTDGMYIPDNEVLRWCK